MLKRSVILLCLATVCCVWIAESRTNRPCEVLLRVTKHGSPGSEANFRCLLPSDKKIKYHDSGVRTFESSQHICAKHCQDGKVANKKALLHLSNVKDTIKPNDIIIWNNEENYANGVEIFRDEMLQCKKMNNQNVYETVDCQKENAEYTVLCDCKLTTLCKLSNRLCKYEPYGDICIPQDYEEPWAEEFGCKPNKDCPCKLCRRTFWTEWTAWSATCGKRTKFRYRPADSTLGTRTVCASGLNRTHCCTQYTVDKFTECSRPRLQKRDTNTTVDTTKKLETTTEEQPVWMSILFIAIGIAIAAIMIMIKKAGFIQKAWKRYRQKSKKHDKKSDALSSAKTDKPGGK